MDDFLDKDERPETLATMENKSEKAAVASNATNSFGQSEGGSGGSMSEIDLQNYNNQQYIGNLYFGGEKQKIPMLFDTGSPMMYVLTDKCDSNLCPQASKFMASMSVSYRANTD